MKVKELINVLEKLNQEQEIKYEGFKYTPNYEIENIHEVVLNEEKHYVIV